MQNNTNIRLSIGANLLIIDSLPSTNEYIKEQIANFKPLQEGTVIMAIEQTRGKGQRNSNWHSEKAKNLTFSYILHPDFLQISKQFLLTVSVSLAIVKFLKQYIKNITIKWPNDILIENKKVCGILIENSLRGMNIRNSIIGIGINVNQIEFDTELEHATSLRLASGMDKEFDLKCLALELFSYLSEEYYKLGVGQEANLLSEYNSLLFGLNECRSYVVDGEAVDGVLMGMGEDGRLQLRLNGEHRFFSLKELKYVF